jgi:hypothetical protein
MAAKRLACFWSILAFARKRCARHFGFVELGWVGVTLAFGPRGGWTMTIGRDGNLRLDRGRRPYSRLLPENNRRRSLG